MQLNFSVSFPLYTQLWDLIEHLQDLQHALSGQKLSNTSSCSGFQ